LRPRQLDEYIGQAQVKENLAILLAAANGRHEAADHVLLYGPPGLGKTTLARALANEVGKGVQIVAGSVVEDPSVLLRLLTGLKDRDVLFVDEIHALPKRVIEALYEAMEDRRISVTVKHGSVTRALGILLPRFTLVAATTEIGRLPEAGVSRFPIREHLVEYGLDDLAAIVTRAAVRGGVAIDAEAARKVASVSRGTARHAIGLVRRLRNEVISGDRDRIDLRAVEAGLAAAGIDGDGLNALERRALEVLRGHGRPMGVSRWAAASKMQVATLRTLCEPELVRLGLVCVTSRGRMAEGSGRAQLRAVAREAHSYADLAGADLTGFVCRDRGRSAAS